MMRVAQEAALFKSKANCANKRSHSGPDWDSGRKHARTSFHVEDDVLVIDDDEDLAPDEAGPSSSTQMGIEQISQSSCPTEVYFGRR